MTKNLKKIGQGHFSKVYKLNNTRVLIQSRDNVKEYMSFGWGFESSFFPNIKAESGYNLYSMKFYPKCTAPKKQLNTKSYTRYKLLRNLDIPYSVSTPSSYYALVSSFKTIKDKPLQKALLNALEGLANYGDDIMFEISPRNITFTKTGNLILLDVFYFQSQLRH